MVGNKKNDKNSNTPTERKQLKDIENTCKSSTSNPV